MKDIELTARATRNLRSRYEEDPVTGCWEWCGTIGAGGYGVISTASKPVYAHRYSAKLHGQDVEGMVVRHSCDNPRCVNPEHLDTGTHGDNVQDRVDRDRTAHGKEHYNARLTEADVIYIRRSDLSIKKLANKLRMPPSTIRDARQYKTWKHI